MHDLDDPQHDLGPAGPDHDPAGSDVHEGDLSHWGYQDHQGHLGNEPEDILGLSTDRTDSEPMRELAQIFGLDDSNPGDRESAYLGYGPSASTGGGGTAPDDPGNQTSPHPDDQSSTQPEDQTASAAPAGTTAGADSSSASTAGTAASESSPARQAELDTMMSNFEQTDHDSTMAILNNLRV